MSRALSLHAGRPFSVGLVVSILCALTAACGSEAPGEASAEAAAQQQQSPEGAAAEVGVSRAELHERLPLLSLRPLSQEPVPQMEGGHIVDTAAAVRLGKAFFWDMQAGSDGQTACASCHFAAGADDRRTGTVNPGLDGVFQTGGVSGPGQTWTPERITSDDRIGSAGMHRALFQALPEDPAVAAETCRLLPAEPFLTDRQVGFRHSPSVVGAAFYRNQFWGGEANTTFNGVSIWGDTANNTAEPLTHVTNASLASQAMGPIGNFTEMTCYGRPLNGPGSLGAKLLARTPLQLQRVAPDDSVLGPLANRSGNGLRCGNAPCTYTALIRAAFGDELAAQAQDQFTVIWGEALAAYQSTLVPDDTPFDRFLSGRLLALTPRQVEGLATFVGKGGCINCHVGAMLSDATVSWYQKAGPLNRDGGDQGFHNIGVRPTDEDLARGDLGIFGGVTNSVSLSPFDMGAFKTPTLRNVKLTAPYFHTGGYPTLEEVVDFYARGGDFANPEKSKDIVPRVLSPRERAALVDFLANALTDCRVEKERAPFDHPELPIPNRATLVATGRRGHGACP
jgi:cytochrome c peroxidase